MGVNRCWIPGCRTKSGDKLILRGLPKDPGLRDKWLKNIPDAENFLPSAGVCELHFPPEEFERIRQDGKRKLKAKAVPTLFEVAKSLPPPSIPQQLQRQVLSEIPMQQNEPMLGQEHGSDRNHSQLSALSVCESPPCPPLMNMLSIPTESPPSDAHACVANRIENLMLSIPTRSPPSDAHVCVANHVENLMLRKVVELQRQEMARMLKDEKENMERIKQLEEENARNASVKRKYQLERACNRRLEARLAEGRFGTFKSLRSDQIAALKNGSAQGITWLPESLRDGLIFKMRCGNSGYGGLVEKYPILPSVRCLQYHVQFMEFRSGILEDMLNLVEAVIPSMNDFERDCALVLDEMKIKEGERRDPSTKLMVGESTLECHSGPASKGLVFMLAGITRRWKLIIAYHLTSSKSAEAQSEINATGNAYREVILAVNSRCEKIGLQVCAVIGDMGADNLAWWKTFHIHANRKYVNCAFPNPVREDAEVIVLPDGPHLLKCIKKMLEKNKVLKLPPCIVEEEGLPSDLVKYEHIEDVLHHEENYELKVAFRLKESNVHVKDHFSKMSVSTARAVVCQRTGVALKLLGEKKQDPSYFATAWFILLISSFFELTNCRHYGLALSRHDESSYQKGLALIRKVQRLFRLMKVGTDGKWKPSQRGVLTLCEGLLRLQEYFLVKKGYSKLLLGRLTSDCIENLFSLIRLGQAVPHALAFIQCLKVVALSMFHSSVKGSSYDYDQGEHLVDPLKLAKQRAAERKIVSNEKAKLEAAAHPVAEITPEDLDTIDDYERCVIYDMAGSALLRVKREMHVCDCFEELQWQSEHPHRYSVVTITKEFDLLKSDSNINKMSQLLVSEECFNAVLIAEITFRKMREEIVSFQHADVLKYLVDGVMYAWEGSAVHQCHEISKKIMHAHLDSRFKQYAIKRSAQIQQSVSAAAALSSKSVYGHEAAKNVRAAINY